MPSSRCWSSWCAAGNARPRQKGSRTTGPLEYEIQLRRKVTLQDVVAALRTPLPEVAIEVRRYHSGQTLDGHRRDIVARAAFSG